MNRTQELDRNIVMPSDNATAYIADLSPPEEDASPKWRVIGLAVPYAELLAAAAKLTEAQAELRDVELNEDTDLFIGPAPPPPDFVTEVESANEIEHFEEVTRIIASDADNRNMLNDNIKKLYLKLSLIVHPDKCTHPEAHQIYISSCTFIRMSTFIRLQVAIASRKKIWCCENVLNDEV